jgi:hypothetical protein
MLGRKAVSRLQRFVIPYGTYSFELYNRPSKWLGKSDAESLRSRLVSIASARLGRTPDFSFFKDTRYLENKLVILCRDRKSGEDLCFCAMSYLGTYKGRNVIHLGAVYSKRENRGLMQLVYIFGLLYVFIRNRLFRKVYLTSLTHTPKIFGVVSECFEHVFPNLNPLSMPADFHHALKDIFIDTYLREWDLAAEPVVDENFVIRGFRAMKDGSILYPDTIDTVPKHRNGAYTKRCVSLIDYEGGDVVLQCGVARGLFTILKNARIFSKG